MTKEEKLLNKLSMSCGKERLLELLEKKIRKMGGFHDVLAFYNDDKDGKLTVEVYPKPGEYAVYRYDGTCYTLRKDDACFIQSDYTKFQNIMDGEIFRELELFYTPLYIWR